MSEMALQNFRDAVEAACLTAIREGMDIEVVRAMLLDKAGQLRAVEPYLVAAFDAQRRPT